MKQTLYSEKHRKEVRKKLRGRAAEEPVEDWFSEDDETVKVVGASENFYSFIIF